MYTKDLRHKMTLRLNDELYEFVTEMSDKYSISPSDFIRQCIAQNMDARKVTMQILDRVGSTTITGVLDNGIDRKTDSDDLV